MAEPRGSPSANLENLRLEIASLRADHQTEITRLEKFIHQASGINKLHEKVYSDRYRLSRSLTACALHEKLFQKFVELADDSVRMQPLVKAYKEDLDKYLKVSRDNQQRIQEALLTKKKEFEELWVEKTYAEWADKRGEFEELFDMSRRAEENRNKASVSVLTVEGEKVQDTLESTTKSLEDAFAEFDLIVDKQNELMPKLRDYEFQVNPGEY